MTTSAGAPDRKRQRIVGTTRRHPRRYEHTARVHSILYQGIMRLAAATQYISRSGSDTPNG